jgi:hypothetical protein
MPEGANTVICPTQRLEQLAESRVVLEVWQGELKAEGGENLLAEGSRMIGKICEKSGEQPGGEKLGNREGVV